MSRGQRKRGRPKGYDGVTDPEIFQRDGWECRMPVCLCPEGRVIDPGLHDPDPWSVTVDHVLPGRLGGTDAAANKRAAHRRCNNEGASNANLPRGLRQRIGDLYPGLAALAESLE